MRTHELVGCSPATGIADAASSIVRNTTTFMFLNKWTKEVPAREVLEVELDVLDFSLFIFHIHGMLEWRIG